MSDLHPTLRLGRYLPREIVGPNRLPLLRAGTRLQPTARDVEVIRVAPGVDTRVHRPPPGGRRAAPGVLYLHGGGFVLGTAAMGDDFCARLARHLDVVVAAVEYRLAPEHPFPIPLEDSYAALRWLAEQPDVDADRIAIVGESAGGGLGAGLALLARERDEVTPVLQVLSYPMLDDRTVDGSAHPDLVRLWGPASNRFGWTAYLGDLTDTDHVPATAAPARAEDLSRLPAAWIGVGTADLFHAEDLAYARRLREAEVACELHEVAGAYHGFDRVEPGAEVSRGFLRARIGALRAALGDDARSPA
ncbi:MAG: alpha/beta hydrolase [Nitriliruptoraceae bacterium]